MIFVCIFVLTKTKTEMKITNNTRSRLFRMAHAIKSRFTTFAKALSHAWRVIRLTLKMMTGNVRFQYRKVSGELRDAVGTLSVSYESKGTGRELPSDSFMYYDCEANGWRSCKVQNINF